MSIITVTAGLALAALVIWTIGAPIARLGGALLTIASLLCIVSGDPIAPAHRCSSAVRRCGWPVTS